MPKIQNSPKPPKTSQHSSTCACCNTQNNSPLDTNTVSIECGAENRKSILSPTVKKLTNRIDFLKDKNTGKKLITQMERQTKKNTRHTYCGSSPQKDFVSIETITNLNLQKEVKRTNFISGAVQCKEIWRCPSCSMKLLKGRASEILQLSKAHQKQGYKLGFVTLTVQHSTDNTLKETLDKLLTNYNKFQQHKFFRNLKQTILIGQVKSLEITYTRQNGWHPHLHILYFYETKNFTKIEPIQKTLIQDWSIYTNGSIKAQNQQIVYTDKHLAEYITKWDAIQELTNDFNKSSKGIKPFQLLTLITKKEHYFKNKSLQKSLDYTASLWLQYVETTRGKRRITTSPKLNQLYKIDQKTDEEILQQKQESKKIISFSEQTWRAIYKHNLQPYLLYICDINTKLKIQQQEIFKFLNEHDEFYLDSRQWDSLKLSEEPIIRSKSEEDSIKNLSNFSFN